MLRLLTINNQKYYLVVMLVEITTVDELVDRLKKGKSRSHDETKAKSEISIISGMCSRSDGLRSG